MSTGSCSTICLRLVARVIGNSAMAVPALMFEFENPVESRLARIEATVDRVRWLLMSGALLGLMARALHWI
jgi:hypothetical protein